MNEREHEGRRDELAAYLLGALEPGEAAALEQHLADCEECRAELRWLRPAVQMLPEAVDPVEPPPELRARLMAEVGAEAKRAERSGAGLVWKRRSPALRPLAGLAVVALLGAAVAGYAIRDGDGGGGQNATTVIAGKAPAVTAEVVRAGEGGTLHLAHVRPLPPDEVLQAWVQREGEVESAQTLFVPNRDGTATVAIDDMQGVEVLMVTAEPRGGSEQPTGDPIVSVSMQA